MYPSTRVEGRGQLKRGAPLGSRDCTPDDRCRSWQQVPWPAKPSFQPRNFPVQFSSLKTVGAGLWLVTHYRNTWLLGTRTLDAVKTKMSKELGGSEGFYWKLQIKKCIFVPFLALCFGFFVFVFLLNYLETVLTRKLTRHISSLCFFKWCLFSRSCLAFLEQTRTWHFTLKICHESSRKKENI